jgi:hypothetical protein
VFPETPSKSSLLPPIQTTGFTGTLCPISHAYAIYGIMRGLRVLIESAAGLERGDRERVAAARGRSALAPFSRAASARQIVERRSQDRGARPWKVDWQRSANRSRPGAVFPQVCAYRVRRGCCPLTVRPRRPRPVCAGMFSMTSKVTYQHLPAIAAAGGRLPWVRSGRKSRDAY